MAVSPRYAPIWRLRTTSHDAQIPRRTMSAQGPHQTAGRSCWKGMGSSGCPRRVPICLSHVSRSSARRGTVLGQGGPQFCWRMRAGRPGKAGCLGLGGALWCPVQSTRCRAKGEVFQTAPLVASCMALGPGVEPVAAFGPHSPQRSQPPLLVVSTPGDYAPLQFFTNLATGPPCAARDWCHLPDMSAC